MDLFYAALIFGLLTGFHCIGMCGPIAISLPLDNNSFIKKLTGGVVYNFGRVVTYTLMGALFGLIGQGFAIAGFQQWVSIVIGALMVLSVFFPLLFTKVSANTPLNKIVNKVKSSLGLLFGKRSISSLFFIGLLNGLLPCGPVYVAIGLSLAGGNVLFGAVYMAVFGLGTIPIMLSLSLLGNYISGAFKAKIRKIVPIFIVLLGMWFIIKGMGLGIHFLSPPDKKLEVKTEMSKDMNH